MSSIGGLVTARVVEGVFFSSCFLLISFSFLCRGGNGRHEGKQCCDIWLYLSDSKFYVNSHLKRAERCHTDPKTFHLKAAQQPIRFYIQQIYRQTRVNVWFWEDMSTSCLGYAMIHNPSRLIPSLWKYVDSNSSKKPQHVQLVCLLKDFPHFKEYSTRVYRRQGLCLCHLEMVVWA